MAAFRIVPQCSSLTSYLGSDPVDPARAHFRAHRCIISSVSRNRVGILRSSFSSVEADCRLSQTMETFPYHRLWKISWKEFSEKRWLVVGTEIDSLEVKNFSSCVELECGTTPLVRDDSARNHLMSDQLG